MACSAPKMKLFQTKIRFLRHKIYQGKTRLIQRSIEFANKFLDEIKDKEQLQRFIRCLNYVFDYFKNSKIICEPLYKRLRKNALALTKNHTNLVKEINKESNIYHALTSLISMHCSQLNHMYPGITCSICKVINIHGLFKFQEATTPNIQLGLKNGGLSLVY